MPLLHNAQKALRSSQAKAVINRRIKSQVKTSMDAVKAKPGSETVSAAFAALDRAAKRGLFHRNKVARLKSQLSRRLAA